MNKTNPFTTCKNFEGKNSYAIDTPQACVKNKINWRKDKNLQSQH